MKFLITGGEGFIGRYLIEKLKSHGHEAKSLDIDGSPDYNTSLLDFEGVLHASKDMDGVFHLAATTSPPQFEIDLNSGFMTNVNGTLNVLRASAENRVKRVVLASSSAVYGDISYAGKEDMVIPGHKNMYATTKLFDEYLGKYYHMRGELEVVAMRYFNAYGVGENTKGMYASIFTHFFKSISKGEKPVVYGDGTQSRDFVYVKDVADATALAMEKGKSGEAYNVGTGISMDFNTIVKLIGEVLGTDVSPEYAPNPFKNYQKFTMADISKIKSEIGWSPKYETKKGAEEVARSFGLKK